MRVKVTLQHWIRQPWFWLGLIVLAGSFVRLAALGRYPLGLHQDEAYSAYNALSVMRYGVDSYGYTRPVYYTVWGSGMSVLYSYLTMPFLALWGISAVTIRLPQAILGCVSILAAFGLGKELFNTKFGLAFAALLAINPWHIQQSRFGLDANLAVPMFLFAVYFLCRFLNGRRNSIWPAAFFFGLTLYCYALTWPLVPILLVLVLIFYKDRIRFDQKVFGAVVLLFIMALPLLLFLAVNFGWLPEIRSGFISIPKLPRIRSDEFSLGRLKSGFLWLTSMLFSQHDDMWWITSPAVGAYYYISTPFILVGAFSQLKDVWQSIRKPILPQKNRLPGKNRLPLHFIMTLWFITMFIIGCTIDAAKFHKVNCLHIPVIFYCLYGIMEVCRLVKTVWAKVAAAFVYGSFFVYFLYTQITYPLDYSSYGNTHVSHMLWNQYEAAIDYAEALTDGPIGVLGLNYANLLLYKEMSPYEYMDTVIYAGDDPAFRSVTAIGRYHFGLSVSEADQDTVFILPGNDQEQFLEAGYAIDQVTDCYSVAYPLPAGTLSGR